MVAVLHWGGFRPGCLVLRATPQGAPDAQVVIFPLDQPARAGDRSVAVFAGSGQGPQVDLVGEALEHDCDGGVVARAQDQGVASSAGPEVTLALGASDPDDDGYISSQAALPGTDCKEGDPAVHPKPGGETLCDGVDDDCTGLADDTNFHVGQACTNGPCQGALVCDGLTATRCSAMLADWYADLDGDDAGGQYLGNFCGPDAGLVGAPGDCDDSDPYVHPGAVEVCNGKDDDCNGVADDFGGTCVRTSLPTTPNANLLVVNAAQRGRAWAAGMDGGLFILSADGGAVNKSGICGTTDWRALWVDAQDRAYLGGPFARVAFAYDAGQGGCQSTSIGGATQVNGAWGYPRADGGTQVFYVTSNANLEYWAPPAAPSQRYQTGSGNDNMRALDGVPPYPMLTAGWFFDGQLHPHVWIDQGAGFLEQGVEPLVGTGLALYSARMPRADLAYACGDKGTVLMMRAGAWSKLPAPSAELPDLNSITAFDETHVYAAGFGVGASYVWAWDGAQWKALVRIPSTAGDVRALGGTAPDDLWAVGKGNAWHFSAP
ncbi:MAG TPA: putative metal-binding motif-containing protein [Dehalococcoidia bacterium]|nr:putative metal-binding motif-containing protein [Dehalococcoidia bacterium]